MIRGLCMIKHELENVNIVDDDGVALEYVSKRALFSILWAKYRK
jgi:hypothetical protein